MTQTGYVTEVMGEYVKVRVYRKSSCGGNCAGCSGCGGNAHIITCRKDGDIRVGETVRLIQADASFFKNVFLGYIMPSILTILCAIAGYAIFKLEGASVLGAGIGLVWGIFLARIFSRGDGEIIASPLK